MPLCEIKNLRKTYPSFTLTDLSFQLNAGQIVGFIGRNGAGKTTTIKSMLGLIHPDGGEVCYFGLPFWGHEEEIKQRIGYSTGAVNYYPKKKIRNIVSVTKTFFSAWDDGAYREYLSLFALDEDKTPSELSEGMKVKFNLLLALSHRAEMLILDEPTRGVDVGARYEIYTIIKELAQQGNTIIMISSDLPEVIGMSDRVYAMYEGKVHGELQKEEINEDAIMRYITGVA